MPYTHEHQREVLVQLFDHLATGSATALRAACPPDVSWWLPLRDTECRGVDEVEAALLQVFSGRAADLESVILGPDAGSAVLEHVLHLESGTTPATSVLTMLDGQVVSGRTYLDVAAWGSLGQVEHA